MLPLGNISNKPSTKKAIADSLSKMCDSMKSHLVKDWPGWTPIQHPELIT